ncbi:MAG: hypothetical protein DWQ47_17125 [Acidobacteria bacterium]|nr:MAG: hypothetical protein DWQ32_04525 [Acidobacteriota bacterium]REK02237.1 MAG: hypothetical protein DWQ38_07625 [Acidobacteriota bacterium]REK13960.1 MAG: hypothetical protein DWQ43_10215 [Acidobacteriota bacterium]REK41955.1 MAG: hypothetical protein DWQ47_17125 [Acidobacteriota bacterium]
MLKGISGIAAFVLTFGLSVSLVGLLFGFTGIGTGDSEVSVEITNFLRQDVNNGELRDRKIRSIYSYEIPIDKYSLSVSDYVSDAENLDDSVLPDDLQYAWRRHLQAWRNHDRLLGSEAKVFRATSECCGNEFKVTYRASGREINETWDQVLRIAKHHGADTRGLK